jgi:hypothetical protein
MKEIEQAATRNMQKIKSLQNSIKEDIHKAHQKKAYYDREIKEYRKIQGSNMATIGAGWLMLWMELQDRTKRDNMIIRIGKNMYAYDKMTDLLQIAHDRHELIKEAKQNGIELSGESKQKLKADRLSFLIDRESNDLFKKDDKGLFAMFSRRDKENRENKDIRQKQRVSHEVEA